MSDGNLIKAGKALQHEFDRRSLDFVVTMHITMEKRKLTSSYQISRNNIYERSMDSRILHPRLFRSHDQSTDGEEWLEEVHAEQPCIPRMVPSLACRSKRVWSWAEASSPWT